MEPLLDSDLHHKFWGDLQAAQNAACREAANTGGAVVAVDAVEIQLKSILLIGTVPEPALTDESTPQCALAPIRSFHTTWGAVLHPSGIIGYLVLGRPVRCRPRAGLDFDLARIAVRVERKFTSIPVGHLGPSCCAVCSRPIPAERLEAMPTARLCVMCQEHREEAQPWSKLQL